MRRRELVLAGVAITAWPFLNLVAANPHEALPLGRLTVYWVVITIPVAILVLTLRHRWAAVTVYTVAILGGLATVVGRLIGVLVATALLLAVAVVISKWEAGRQFAAVLTVVLVFASVVQGLVAGPSIISVTPSTTATHAEPWPLPVGATPNIYWIVLDGYGRSDLLAQRNQSFHSNLEQQGFQISRSATANYPLTFMSMATTLWGEYLDDTDRLRPPRSDFERWIQGDNPVVATLKEWGYHWVHTPAEGWISGRCSGLEDTCLHPGGLSELDRTLLNMTPLHPFLSSPAAHDRRQDPAVAVDRVLASRPPEPFFALIHLLNPHAPIYRSGPDCILQHVTFSLSAPWGSPGEYAEIVACLNQRLEVAVDSVLAGDPDAIVILQGDHGPRHETIDFADGDVDEWTDDQIRDRFSVFSAIRVTCSIPDDLSLVNTFRIVLSCISGNNLELLPSRSWIANRSGAIREVEPPQ